MTIDDLVRAFAGPILAYGKASDTETARTSIESLFAAKDSAAVERVLAWYASAGLRQEWAYFDYYVSRGFLKANPRDLVRTHKFAFIMAHRKRVGKRSLIALDATRACALAEWAILAGFLSRERATAAVATVVASAVAAHTSWAKVREQLLIGLEYAEGQVDDELRAGILELDGPWPTEPPALPVETETRPLTFALRLALDCPSCGYAVALPGIVDQTSCRFCGSALELGPDDWSYFFSDDLSTLRSTPEGFDPIGNDYGVRFFSRRMTRPVPGVVCDCGKSVTVSAPGTVRCDCERGHVVRAADALAKAIDAKARFVVEPLPKSIDPTATFRCAACDHEQPLGHDSSRVRVCIACEERTYVDDAAHARSFDPPRLPTLYLIADS